MSNFKRLKNNKPGQAGSKHLNQRSFCTHCKKQGHTTNDCQNKKQNQQNTEQTKGGKPLRPCKFCQENHKDYECPKNSQSKNKRNNDQKQSSKPCKRCGNEWHHGHKCDQAQNVREPSRPCRHCGESHYDNQCPQASKRKLPNNGTLLCTVCNEGVHTERNCPLVRAAEKSMPAYNKELTSQKMAWSPTNDFIANLEDEEEGPRYLDARNPQGRPELDPPFGFGAWEGTGNDPEILPDAPPLVDEYVPFNAFNYESWQYYRYQEEATRQLRFQQQQPQRRGPFVYVAPQPYGMPFSNWMNYCY